MPLKFWKKEKAEEGKAKEGKAEPKRPEAAPKPREPGPQPAKPSLKPAPAVPAKPSPATVEEIHSRLVDLGLTVAPTKGVFQKRVASFEGGEAQFLKDYRSEPFRVVTRVLSDWIGFRVPEAFEPEAFLNEVNPRLSSFHLSVQARDLSWLDQDLNLRKAKISLGERERVVRFKDARDFMRAVNELLAPKKLAFLELETWSDDFVFLLVREPRWDKLADTDLVVVKADQTAKGGECGECGATVGRNWNDCLKCGAVFS